MKRILNTLYVTSAGTYLRKNGETIEVKVKSQPPMRIPVITIGGIVCFGAVRVSPPLMLFCSERGIAISFLSPHGRFYGRVVGPTSGNVLLRRTQYRWADDDYKSVEIARNVVCAKVANCRTVLMRAMRDHDDMLNRTSVQQAVDHLNASIVRAQAEHDLNAVRGIEGDSGRTYFNVFDHLIFADKMQFKFERRSRRPPLDRVNALLSFVYTLLYHDVRSALEVSGLDPAVGYLHRDRPGRMGLALDLMEEFRPVFADRLVLSLINRQQILAAAFRTSKSGAVLLNDAHRKTVISAYQNRKQESIRHLFLDEQMKIGTLFVTQSLLFARYLRGDIDGYPPFIWK